MPIPLAPGIWSLVASAGLTVSYQAGVRVETRAEQVRPPVGENATTGVLEVQPGIGLLGEASTLRFELDYAPRYTRVGGDGPDDDSWLQRAWGSIRWRPDAAWQLHANATAMSGTVDLFRISTAPDQIGQPPPVGQSGPVASTLDYQRYEMVLGADGRFGRRLDLRSSLALLREGGVDTAERETLPLQHSALVRGELAWHLSGRTTLAGILSGSGTHYFDVAIASGGTADSTHQSWSIWMGFAEALWRHTLTRHTRAWIGAGLVLIGGGAPGAGQAGLEPIGEVGLIQESGPGWPRLSGGVQAATAPLEDRLTGTVALRAEVRAWGAWAPAQDWTLGASALGARVMNGSTEREAFSAGDAYLTRNIRDFLSITIGGRWTTQWPAPVTGRIGLPTSRWVAFISVQAAYSNRPAGLPFAGSFDSITRSAH